MLGGRLQADWYTEREASFLALALVHSGSFVLRQFLAVSKVKPGSVADSFTRQLQSQRDVKPIETRLLTGAYVYELSDKLYQSVDLAPATPAVRRRIPERLMCLDFAIQNPDERFLAEDEKAAYFQGVDQALIPSRRNALTGSTRLFTEGFPIIARPSGGAIFVYADTDYNLSRFRSFLRRYLRLMLALDSAGVVFVTTGAAMAAAAHRAFIAECQQRPQSTEAIVAEFCQRKALESMPTLTQEQLNELRILRSSRQASGYDSWLENPASLAHCGKVISFRAVVVANTYRLADEKRGKKTGESGGDDRLLLTGEG